MPYTVHSVQCTKQLNDLYNVKVTDGLCAELWPGNASLHINIVLVYILSDLWRSLIPYLYNLKKKTRPGRWYDA